LQENKKYLVKQRLEPLLIKQGCKTFAELNQKLMRANKGLQDEIISAITTNETSFFRDNHVYEEINRYLIPLLFDKVKKQNVKIWSAACSTGQEPYTLSMLINEYIDKKRINDSIIKKFDIMATDIDSVVLDKAREGVYNNFEIKRGLSSNKLDKYFEEADKNKYKATFLLKRLISFSKMNLTDFHYYPRNIDVIFCRNVLIYFDRTTIQEILNKMYSILAPDGILIIGSAENLYGFDTKFKKHESGRLVYYKK